MSAIFDFTSLLVVITLFVCNCAFLRSIRPNIFTDPQSPSEHRGFRGFAWKMSRIGERCSPAVALCCASLAVHTLFIR